MARPRGFRLSPFALRDVLAAQGLSLTDGAERTGVPLTTLSALMHDDCRASVKTATKLADGLNCSKETLFPEAAFWVLRDATAAGAA